jgi:two-component system, response regulator
MRQRHILLVEDNADDEALTLRTLKKSNVVNEIRVARDGAEALEQLFGDESIDAESPALILLDLNLPKIDGLDVLRRVRSDKATRLIPVVILTSSKEQEDVAAGYSCGANAYVRKPVSSYDFAEAVHSLSVFWLILSELPPDLTVSLRA